MPNSCTVSYTHLIDEELLQKDREHAIIHIYISPESNPAEAVSFLEERFQAERIPYEIDRDSCVEEDWINNWKKYFHPIPVGEKLLIRPLWEDDYDAQGRTVLHLEPGLALSLIHIYTVLYAHWDSRDSGDGSKPTQPTGPSTDNNDGWTDIQEEIGGAEDGDTITVDMNGETEVPGEIFEEVAGKDVTVEFDMGGGVSWTVNGEDVPTNTDFSDLNLGVDMDTSGISVDVINTITGEYGAVPVSYTHLRRTSFAHDWRRILHRVHL